MDEGLEDGHERLLVAPEDGQSDLADLQKDAFVSSDAQPIDHVLQMQIQHANVSTCNGNRIEFVGYALKRKRKTRFHCLLV